MFTSKTIVPAVALSILSSIVTLWFILSRYDLVAHPSDPVMANELVTGGNITKALPSDVSAVDGGGIGADSVDYAKNEFSQEYSYLVSDEHPVAEVSKQALDYINATSTAPIEWEQVGATHIGKYKNGEKIGHIRLMVGSVQSGEIGLYYSIKEAPARR